MNKLGLNVYFVNPNDITTVKFKQICTKKLEEQFSQEWQILLNAQIGKLRFYKTVKQTFAREPYLDNLNCFQLRKIVTKFRCSDHRLEIELGRHGNVIPGNRICQICRGNVETESHFLAECPLYSKLRLKYLGTNVEPNIINIIQPNDKTMSYNLANYLTKATDLRLIYLGTNVKANMFNIIQTNDKT